ncbi:metal ABC transporter substrate-binding protein [Actinocorallia sp. B10E7]|uniref:metal ABC transporter substrate-binding protein n=1 Tax=Actinocorallia sp. B10E7 TaxID=3153558 RepID=UPI00325C83AC
MKRSVLVSGVLSVALLATAACGGGGSPTDGKTEITASFYPVAWLAERVGGGHAAVTVLTKPGTEPHDVELSPRQVAEITETGLGLYVKGLQPAVDDAFAQHAADRSLDVASLVTLVPAAEHEHEGAEGEAHEGETDPHLWLDPSRMATVATGIGEKLASVDPANAADYRANAAKTAGELNALDGEFKTGLSKCEQHTIVTSHAAFSYLADRYGLEQVAISGIDPDSEPSPRRMAELSDQIKALGVTTVFTETLVSPKLAQTLADGAGVKTAVLDPVEGVKEGSKDDYLSVQRRNLEALKTALVCS